MHGTKMLLNWRSRGATGAWQGQRDINFVREQLSLSGFLRAINKIKFKRNGMLDCVSFRYKAYHTS